LSYFVLVTAHYFVQSRKKPKKKNQERTERIEKKEVKPKDKKVVMKEAIPQSTAK
jgi:hypothetical protein